VNAIRFRYRRYVNSRQYCDEELLQRMSDILHVLLVDNLSVFSFISLVTAHICVYVFVK